MVVNGTQIFKKAFVETLTMQMMTMRQLSSLHFKYSYCLHTNTPKSYDCYIFICILYLFVNMYVCNTTYLYLYFSLNDCYLYIFCPFTCLFVPVSFIQIFSHSLICSFHHASIFFPRLSVSQHVIYLFFTIIKIFYFLFDYLFRSICAFL